MGATTQCREDGGILARSAAMAASTPHRAPRITLSLLIGLAAFVPMTLHHELTSLPAPHFTAWHTLLEAIAVAFAFQIAVSAWYRSAASRPLRSLALGFLGVSALDLAHLLVFPGMPVWLPGLHEGHTQAFWLAGRGLTALTLLMLTFEERWTRKLALLLGAGTALGIGVALAAMPMTVLARAQWAGAAAHAPSVAVSIVFVAMAIWWARLRKPPLRADLVAVGLVVLAIGEALPDGGIATASMSDVLGHVYKVIGTGLLLRAVVHAHIVQPYRDLLHEKRNREHAAVQLDALVHGAPDGIVVMTGNGGIVAANPAADRLFGAEAGTLLGRRVEELMPEALRDRHPALHGEARPNAPSRPMSATTDLKAARIDGGTLFVDIALSPVRWEGEACTVAFVRDSTVRVQQMQRINWLASHDELTGLPNRWALVRELGRRLAGDEGGLCLEFDIDHFSRFNEALGHTTGDDLLQAFAARLAAAVQGDEFLARAEGDRFVILLADTMAAAERIKVLLALTSHPLLVSQDLRLNVTASGGFCRFPVDARTPEAILQATDMATTRAKREHRHTVVAYHPSLPLKGKSWVSIANRLNGALEVGQFRLVYQPKLGLQQATSLGFEALLRWRSAQGDISPAEFIPIAEESGHIIRLGRWTISQAIAQAAAWRMDGLDPGRIAVNLSARQLGDVGLTEYIATELRRHALPPAALELEITESVAMENLDWALPRLEALAGLGVRLSLDDFGTGYSSLAYLQKLPAEVLKIDLRFVQAIGSAEGEVLLRAIIGLAHGLGKKVVAEGVETPQQDRWLRAAGCDEAQGWLYGRPLEVADAGTFIRGMARITPPR